MVSTKDNNKEYPISSDTSAWVTFYKQNDKNINRQLVYDELSQIILSSLSDHMRDYHISGLTNSTLDKFVLRDP